MAPLIETNKELLASLRALVTHVAKPIQAPVAPKPQPLTPQTVTPPEPLIEPDDELSDAELVLALEQAMAADALDATDVQEIEVSAADISVDVNPNRLVPRGYQIEGINVLRDKKRALLYDAAGLGKTLQAAEAAVTPCIVAAPTFLVYQWADFLEAQYPNAKVVVCDGPRIRREKLLSESADWYIINIEMLSERKNRTDNSVLSYDFPQVTTFIIDESHHVRGRNSSQSRGALDLARRTERVYLLSATPQYKQVDDLYMQLRILYPNKFTSYNNFLAYYCRISNNGFSRRVIAPRSHAMIQELLRNHGIGRTYSDVAVELPELIRSNIAIRAEEEFMREYNRIKHTFVYNEHDLNSLMEAMQVLRRVTAKVKVGKCLEILLSNPEPEGLIITWYKDTAKALAEIMQIPCITGEMSVQDRVLVAKESKLLVATMASIGEGLDLSHLSDVIFLESSYVPGQIYQALSRVRRARTNPAPVRCSFIYVKGTIDENVHVASMQRSSDIRKIMRAALLGDDTV